MSIFNKNKNLINGYNTSDIRREFGNSVFEIGSNEKNVLIVLSNNIKIKDNEICECSYEELFKALNNKKSLKKFFENEKLYINDIQLSNESKIDYNDISVEMVCASLGISNVAIENVVTYFEQILELNGDSFERKAKELKTKNYSQFESFVKYCIELYLDNEFDSNYKQNVLQKLMNNDYLFEDCERARNFVANNDNMWN